MEYSEITSRINKSLSIFNRISFVEEKHYYKIDNKDTNCPSVTQLLKRFKHKFDADAAAARVAKRMRTTVAQVLADWALGNLYSTTIGTMLHNYIENYYNKVSAPYKGNFDGLGYDEKKDIATNFPKLVKQFHNFYNDNQHLHCIKNEIILGDIDDTNVCGMSDMLSYNSNTNQLEILDFKTNKRMQKKTKYGNLKYPFDDMSEGEINEYCIQLNTYKYFVEKHTDLKIGKKKIIWFNINNPNYEIYELDNIQPKISEMFNVFKASSLFEP